MAREKSSSPRQALRLARPSPPGGVFVLPSLEARQENNFSVEEPRRLFGGPFLGRHGRRWTRESDGFHARLCRAGLSPDARGDFMPLFPPIPRGSRVDFEADSGHLIESGSDLEPRQPAPVYSRQKLPPSF